MLLFAIVLIISSAVSAFKLGGFVNMPRKYSSSLEKLKHNEQLYPANIPVFDLSLGAGKGFGMSSHVDSQAKVIKPTPGTAKNEKFLMMYTCKICNGRNAQMVCHPSLHVSTLIC